MEYRNLGRTGVKVSPLCLGSLNFGVETPEMESIEIIDAALQAGINFIDTANYYNGGESERVIGKALREGKRQRVVLATKFHFPNPGDSDPNAQGNSRKNILQAVEGSLRRLQTDWIDLYQVHRPVFDVPQDETLRALDDLIRQGKVRYIGASTFPSWMLMEALHTSEVQRLARFVTEQPPYNLLDRRIENELVPFAQRYNLGLLPWSPLAMGMLAGRYPDPGEFPLDSRAAQRGSIYADRVTKRAVTHGNQILPIAAERDLTPAQLALLWTKDQPAVTAPVLGPRTLAHLEDALPIMDKALDPETSAVLDRLFPPGNASADFHNTSGWMKTTL